ncbi:50S ribosomal protein L23 [Blochmannia endosymbiont of Polyrhachis (Hedomyrma) turneri]|uniref:50S ribosomal protein L23 n=1 Tax=Blochmannia endosymbiont of Polyrhachis (Hedomyrma) turneri TaxID=1505596 RepID=UPI00061A7345|nr:50S ribosomal protein L23 [Blochmannia endosymbiont of Polyrhachis (Hedomyrma) turneri]
MFNDRLLRVLYFPHMSEKSSSVMEKCNVVVFSVKKTSTKSEIKNAVNSLFSVDVCNVRTLIVKGKVKKRGKNISKCSNWKKAYVTLASGHSIDFTTKIKKNVY